MHYDGFHIEVFENGIEDGIYYGQVKTEPHLDESLIYVHLFDKNNELNSYGGIGRIKTTKKEIKIYEECDVAVLVINNKAFSIVKDTNIKEKLDTI